MGRVGGHDGHHLLLGQVLTVRPLRRQRVIHIGHHQNARQHTQLACNQAVRIAAAIHLFMVRSRDQSDGFKARDTAQQAIRICRMPPQNGPLVCIQFSRLVQHRVRHAQLANVVQQRGPAQIAQLPFIQIHFNANGYSVACDFARVQKGVVRLRVDDLCKSGADVVEGCLFCQHSTRPGLQVHHGLHQFFVRLVAPQIAVAMHSLHRRDHLRIEPATAALNQHCDRTVAAGQLLNHFQVLRDVSNLRQQRNVAATQAFGLARTVPVFIQAADRVGCL